VRTADERRSVPNTCSVHPTGWALGDRPSIHATANDPGIPRTGHGFGIAAVLATHEAIPPTAAVVVGLNREDVE